MEDTTQTLKDMAMAYELASEFDHCPDNQASAEEYLGEKVPIHVLQNYSGLRPDEIANRIIKKIKQL